MTDEFNPTLASPSPRGEGAALTNTEQPERSLSELAWSEWETIQKKIDNVSTFPFTIKTWTVALSVALLGLGRGFDFPPKALFAVAIVPILFWAIEAKHHRVRDTLGRRAEFLELFIERLIPLPRQGQGSVPSSLRRELGRLPGVALSIKRDGESLKRDRFSFARPDGKTRIAWAYRNMTLVWQKWIVRYADPIFYLFQVALVIAITSSLAWFRTPLPDAPKSLIAFPPTTLSTAPSTGVSIPLNSPLSPPQPSPPSSSELHLQLNVDANGFCLSSADTAPAALATPNLSPSPHLLDSPK
jgi:hypothetical protein